MVIFPHYTRLAAGTSINDNQAAAAPAAPAPADGPAERFKPLAHIRDSVKAYGQGYLSDVKGLYTGPRDGIRMFKQTHSFKEAAKAGATGGAILGGCALGLVAIPVGIGAAFAGVAHPILGFLAGAVLAGKAANFSYHALTHKPYADPKQKDKPAPTPAQFTTVATAALAGGLVGASNPITMGLGVYSWTRLKFEVGGLILGGAIGAGIGMAAHAVRQGIARLHPAPAAAH